jgi:hypothetical protein
MRVLCGQLEIFIEYLFNIVVSHCEFILIFLGIFISCGSWFQFIIYNSGVLCLLSDIIKYFQFSEINNSVFSILKGTHGKTCISVKYYIKRNPPMLLH